MAHYAVYRSDDGRLVSEATAIRLPLPAGLTYREYADWPGAGVEWSEAARDYVARPGGAVDVDLADAVLTHPLFPGTVTTLIRARVRDAVAAVLDRYGVRFQ